MEYDDGQSPEPNAERLLSSIQVRLNTLFAKASEVCGEPSTSEVPTPKLQTSVFQLGEFRGKRCWPPLPSLPYCYYALTPVIPL